MADENRPSRPDGRARENDGCHNPTMPVRDRDTDRVDAALTELEVQRVSLSPHGGKLSPHGGEVSGRPVPHLHSALGVESGELTVAQPRQQDLPAGRRVRRQKETHPTTHAKSERGLHAVDEPTPVALARDQMGGLAGLLRQRHEVGVRHDAQVRKGRAPVGQRPHPRARSVGTLPILLGEAVQLQRGQQPVSSRWSHRQQASSLGHSQLTTLVQRGQQEQRVLDGGNRLAGLHKTTVFRRAGCPDEVLITDPRQGAW